MKLNSFIAVGALCAVPAFVQSAHAQQAAEIMIQCVKESLDIQERYADIIADVTAKKMTEEEGAQAIEDLAGKIRIISQRGNKAQSEFTEDDMKKAGEMANDPQFLAKLQAIAEKVKKSQAQLQALNSPLLNAATAKFLQSGM